MALTAKKVYAILKRQISDMEAKLNSPVRYRGTVATADLLPLNPDIGDMYNIESKSVYGEAGMNVAWNGVVWDTMGAPIDMSLYLTKEEAEAVIQRLVTEYFEKNPVKPGATTEQAQQIEQNKTDIASLKTETGSLKEDLSNKITKFYASNQGKTHLADSDNGKIMDMMIYGKSSQDGTPTPENPVEIKSVVNPTVKVCGKNLLNLNSYKENVKNGITITPIFNNEELQYLILNGTFKTAEWAEIWIGTLNPGTYTFSAQNSNVKVLRNWNEQNNTFTVTDENSVYRIVTNSSNIGESVKNVKIYPQLELGSTPTSYEPYHEQTVTLPYTLNAIPVESGGNVTIDGQQYIADYVDVERGKLVKKIKEISKDPIVLVQPTNNPSKKRFILGNKFLKSADNFNKWSCKCSNLQTLGVGTVASYGCIESCGIDKNGNLYVYYEETSGFTTAEEFKAWWGKRDIQLMGILETPIKIDLTPEEIAAFKALATYYPTTNISINSDQLDGYTVFNYPISMENGWNYVKQQIGDTREYIYDMDARTQDTDLQAAEAYVNSEYAVALTELEV